MKTKCSIPNRLKSKFLVEITKRKFCSKTHWALMIEVENHTKNRGRTSRPHTISRSKLHWRFLVEINEVELEHLRSKENWKMSSTCSIKKPVEVENLNEISGRNWLGFWSKFWGRKWAGNWGRSVRPHSCPGRIPGRKWPMILVENGLDFWSKILWKNEKIQKKYANFHKNLTVFPEVGGQMIWTEK